MLLPTLFTVIFTQMAAAVGAATYLFDAVKAIFKYEEAQFAADSKAETAVDTKDTPDEAKYRADAAKLLNCTFLVSLFQLLIPLVCIVMCSQVQDPRTEGAG
jgi:hypothetical protein